MNKRRLTRLVVAIFSASVLFVASGVTPSAWGGDDGGGTGVVCTGTPSDFDARGNPNTCTITPINSTSPGNDECSLFSTQPDVTQRCIITQTGPGNNTARVRMVIAQSTSAPPFNGICPFPLRSLLALANQNGCQILTVTQTSLLGSNSLDAAMVIGQTLGSGATQGQNAGQDHKVTQCAGLSPGCPGLGTNLATINLGQGQNESSWIPVGSQSQRSTGHGTISQLSGPTAGAPQATRNFGAVQNQYAPSCALPLTPCQFQDPEDYCCFNQALSPNAVLTLRQGALQIQNPSACQGQPGDPCFPNQSDSLAGRFTTTGNGTLDQQVTRFHGGTSDTTAQTCAGNACNRVITCDVEGCFKGSIGT
jgi:hypothetical protein